MEQNDTTQYIQQDTIDFRALLAVLKKRQKLIWSVTAILTVLALFFTFLITKPIYQSTGSVTIEVGEIVNEQLYQWKDSSLVIHNLDNVNNLKNIINEKFDIDSSIPTYTTLLTYSFTDKDKEIVEETLQKALDFTIGRSKKKAKFYSGTNSKVQMTQVINDIKIKDTTVYPKRKLIVMVAFITGLMLSIFLAFFLEFIAGMKKEDD